MPSARFSAGGANSPSRYATTYATPEVIDATWTAVPQGATGGAIEIRPYPTAAPNAGGGFAIPAPPPSPLDGFDDYGGKRYLDASGNPQWMPTPDEIARDRRAGLPVQGIDYDRLDGMDGSYAGRPPKPVAPNPAASVGRAASGSLDDVIRGVGGVGGLAAGGILAGGVAGLGEYNSGGGVASAVGVGVGAGLGSAVGAVVGGVAGSALGPVGTVVGGMVGGALGSALGSALGDAAIPDANLNGAMSPGSSTDAPTNGATPGALYAVKQTGGTRFDPNTGIYNPIADSIFRHLIGPVRAEIVVAYPFGRYVKTAYLYGQNSTRQVTLESNYNNGQEEIRGRQYLLIREDGGIDPVPYNPNARTKPATGTPGIRLPGIDPSPFPFPFPGPTGKPGPAPVPRPIGEPNPTGDPTTGPDGYPNPTGDPTGQPGPAPYPDPTGQPGGGGGGGGGGNDDDNEPCDPCEKLDQILELLQPEIAGQIDLSPCPVDDGETVQDIRTIEGAGLVGISEKLGLTLQGLDALWELLRCQDEDQRAFPIPDSWELKKELNCPQLIIVCKKPGDKSSYRRSFSIPHPNSNVSTEEGAKRVFTYRRTYNRGSHLTQLILKDNSKIKLTTDSRNSGQSLMDWLVGSCLDLSYQDSPPGEYRHGENTGWEIIPATVEFYTVCYYSQGKKSNVPDWIFTIPE